MSNAQSVGNAVGYFNAGSHVGFRSVDLTGVSQVVVRYGTSNAGVAEIRAGGVNGQLLMTINTSNTGGYATYQNFTLNSASISGVHDLYVVGKSGSGIFNLDKLTLVKSGGTSSGGGSSSASSVAACNDSNSTALGSAVNVAPGKCYKYNHGSGKLQLGTWNLSGSASYEVMNCNGAVINASQVLNAYTSVSTNANHCNHYIFVKSAPSSYTLQVGSW